jgi:tight adherence protein B
MTRRRSASLSPTSFGPVARVGGRRRDAAVLARRPFPPFGRPWLGWVARAVGRRRDAAVLAALPDVLERVAAGLRAGAAPAVALADVAGAVDLPEALAADLRRVLERAEERGLEAALAAWAQERPLPAVAAVAAALQFMAGTGGPAAPALDGLAAGLRDRHDAAGEVAALSAQARLSAIVVGAAPLVSLALSLLVDRRVAPTLVGTAPGRACLLTGLVLQAAAALWMRRIVGRDA